MDALIGYFLYFLSLLSVGGIYALLALGLNVNWGFAGLFNAGIAGFAAVGAYTFSLLTTAESTFHYGGLGLPVVIGEIAAFLIAGIIAAVIAGSAKRLGERSDKRWHPSRTAHVLRPNGGLIHPSDDGAAIGCANPSNRKRMGVTHALRSQLVQVRRDGVGVAITPQVGADVFGG